MSCNPPKLATALTNLEAILDAYDAMFLTTLFSLDEEEISDPIVLDESVGVFQLAERTPLLEEDIAYLTDYYPYVAQQNIEQDHNAFLLASDEFDDNFTAVFGEAFLGQ